MTTDWKRHYEPTLADISEAAVNAGCDIVIEIEDCQVVKVTARRPTQVLIIDHDIESSFDQEDGDFRTFSPADVDAEKVSAEYESYVGGA